jgi:hypothetical protein
MGREGMCKAAKQGKERNATQAEADACMPKGIKAVAD